MIDLFSLCNKDVNFKKAQNRIIENGIKKTLIYGLNITQKSILIAAAYLKKPKQILISLETQEELEQLKLDITELINPSHIFELQAFDFTSFKTAAKSLEVAATRLDIFTRLLRDEKIIVLSTVETTVQPVIPREMFVNKSLIISLGETLNRNSIIEKLINFEYERVDEVNTIGQFSVRGGIIDIFPLNNSLPVRIEFFDDEVDSLREFDPVSQRSTKELNFIDIIALFEPNIKDRTDSVLSYLAKDATIIFNEPLRSKEKILKTIKEYPELKKQTLNWEIFSQAYRPFNCVFFTTFLTSTIGKISFSNDDNTNQNNLAIGITTKEIAPFHRQIDLFTSEIKEWQQQKFFIIILINSRDKSSSIIQRLKEDNIFSTFSEDFDCEINAGQILISKLSLTNGFELPNAKLVILTENDIFSRQKRKQVFVKDKSRQLSYFRDIKIGDYVVHEKHGVGKYVGIKTIEVSGINKDYLHIKYAGDDKLFVPVDQIGLLKKYVGAEGDTPRLSKMGGADWLKVTRKAKAAVENMAKELLEIYAQRQVEKGFSFPTDTHWQREFEDTFPFEETPDQATAVIEVKKDMEREIPMDRLLCGDVGFGKTEVAARAAFKATLSGKQTAFLVPTTVLAQQHYNTLKDRFEGFGAVVDVLSRFRNQKEQKEILKNLRSGKIDILIGTHRLIQKDVKFKDLGLLIVDEEQRFGVAQKERFKKWKPNLDILTLSATPIPRTLHMSLTGARDMSIIETPPENRYPIQSYVVEYNDIIIKEAIERELKRGGQVYFVYNKVATIDKVTANLRKLLPEAKINTAHGQMNETILEQVILDFYENRFDVIVCTSIIENGLDIPNANTIIIYDSDHFGLSQLYQIRGRVGRSKRLAYAYFTYRPNKILSEIAEKRLKAVKEFAELGSGFKIAMRDLEIRGAGSLLGREQHGHIVNVGFEMYCQLLNETIKELNGEEKPKPTIEPVLDLNVNAYIPQSYIKDSLNKIEIYQKVASITTEEDVNEILDELIDRFGEPPEVVINLLNVARVKNSARQTGISNISDGKDHFIITFGEHPNIPNNAIENLRKAFAGKVTFPPGPSHVIKIRKQSKYKQHPINFILQVFEYLQ